MMANLGMADSLILMVMALVVFGPRRLPQIGRQIGKLMYEFRKASNDFKFQMEEELRLSEDADRRKKEEERQKALAAAATATPAVLPDSAASAEPSIPASPETAPVAESNFSHDNMYSATPADVAKPADPAEESYPRILPPSTGELVEAQRPNRYPPASASGEEASAQQGDLFVAQAGIEADRPPLPYSNQNGDNTPTSPEQAAHHG
jgi:sec-independent protein translocase protein TatB